MSDSPADQLIQVRMQQAKESLTEAETLYRASLFRGAINRSYYAMFYAVSALAVLRQEPTSKHSRLIAFFDRQFVKPGIFPKELSKSLHLAFQRRQENDYGNVLNVNDDDAQRVYSDARSFVESIEKHLLSLHK